ncbi:MAG: hypothetical protein QCI82_07880 [Candidatus Thermoplasmatota archaeon]|nr:hypothetical protein [Candidatus Thermoplasmatota archaeon]
MASLGEVISENFILLLLSVIGFILLLLLLQVLKAWVKGRNLKIKAQYEMDMAKLEIAKKKAFMEELRNSTVVLNNSERQRLESIRTDNSILTRKLISDMNEIEERIKRLEIGSDTVRTSQILGMIKRHEGKLFNSDRR